ncbi:hypothetical protein Bca52824_066168 [Brassica carinata]|uniref:Uncharacterized protein n=1 Tax=Brassica carinata TaxID=52824 RepID=A0A8X7QKL9_BRACI|nr:hypothetical protein Bca52824_066168 [Brassica carinata]
MSKRSSSSVPTMADRARLKRRMESLVSRSDSSSEAGEGSDCDLMAPLPLSCVYAAPPLVGPGSSVEERASSYIPGEIAVYEASFDSGLRGTIPALIAGLCNLFEISPSQLNPSAWRILIAIQNLGDLEYLSLGINGVLFAYHLAPLNGGEGLLPIVEELPKTGTHPAPSEGEKSVLRARQLPAYRRQETCREALPVILLQPIKKRRSHRSPVVKLEPSPSLLGKRPKSGGVTTRSTHQSADIARSAGSLATTLSNLNLNIFPQDGTVMPIGDSSEVV